jgi:hypothetical protein
MKKRCFNEKNPKYLRYGGRGITVCEEWKNDPVAFIEWALSNGYGPKLSLDRRNNNGNYEPSNCRFATQLVQQRNRNKQKRAEEFLPPHVYRHGNKLKAWKYICRGKREYIGLFCTINEAQAAIAAAHGG